MSKNIPAILVEVDRIVRSHALFAIISTSEYTETYVALATIAGQYLIPVIDAAAENRKRYFALVSIIFIFRLLIINMSTIKEEREVTIKKHKNQATFTIGEIFLKYYLCMSM